MHNHFDEDGQRHGHGGGFGGREEAAVDAAENHHWQGQGRQRPRSSTPDFPPVPSAAAALPSVADEGVEA